MADSTSGESKICVEFDLTQSIIPYIDRHMALPMLEHLQEKKLFPEEDLSFAKYQLVAKTPMVHYTAELFHKLTGRNTTADLKSREEKVLSDLNTLKTACTPLLTALLGELADEKKMEKASENTLLDTIKHAINMQAASQFSQADFVNIKNYARLIFDCGHYKRASIYIYIFRSLSNDDEMNFQALWGSLSSGILVCYSPANLERALDVVKMLRDAIDQRVKVDHLTQLQQRAWLIHWSLFLFFNPNQAPTSTYNGILDFFFQDKTLNAIMTECPHILRYITVALVANIRNRRSLLENDLVGMLRTESYRDPFTSFVVALYTDFDMVAAQEHLAACEALFETDFFLSLSSHSRQPFVRDHFMENARRLVFEVHCKTHERIDLNILASRMVVAQADISKVIAPFIRDAGLEAKVDNSANLLVVDRALPTVHQQINSKTKGLAYRSSQLSAVVEKQLSAAQ